MLNYAPDHKRKMVYLGKEGDMQHGLLKFSVILGLAALLALPSLAISQPQADAAVQQRPGANSARAMAGEIRAAIGAGEITAEQGRARIARLRERMGPGEDAVGANERRSRRSSYRSPSSWDSSRAAARSQRCCRPSWDPSRGRSDGRG